jgi:hypothetical protein
MLSPLIVNTRPTFTIKSAYADGEVPSVKILSPENGSNIGVSSNSFSVILSGMASDAGSGVATVEVIVTDPVTRATLFPYAKAQPSSSGWSNWTYNASFDSVGDYRFTARATDNAGNKAWYSVIVSISLDSTETPATFSRISAADFVTWDALPSDIQWDSFTDVEVFHVYPKSDGTWVYDWLGWDVKSFVDTAHMQDKRVHLVAGGWLPENDGSGQFPIIFASSPLRTTSITNLVNEMKSKGFDGITVDVEGSVTDTNWPGFMLWLQELSASVRSTEPGATIYWDVYASGWQIADGIDYVDKVMIMAYDVTESYSFTGYDDQGIDQDKLIGGIHLALEIAATLDSKLAYLNQNGFGGYLFWEASQITPEYYQIIKTRLGE